MTDKKQIKGLLDYISLKPGEEAEYAHKFRRLCIWDGSWGN